MLTRLLPFIAFLSAASDIELRRPTSSERSTIIGTIALANNRWDLGPIHYRRCEYAIAKIGSIRALRLYPLRSTPKMFHPFFSAAFQ